MNNISKNLDAASSTATNGVGIGGIVPNVITTSMPDSTDVSIGNSALSFRLSFPGGPQVEQAFAIFLLVAGVTLVFFGERLFRVALFLTCAIFTGALLYYVLITQGVSSRTAVIVGAIVGVCVASFVVCLYWLALVLAGAATGAVLWLGFQSLFPDVVSQTGLYIMLAVAVLLCAVLALWLEEWLLLFATPVLGAFMCALGIGKYATELRGFNAFEALYNDSKCDNNCFHYSLGFLGLALLGLLVQYFLTSGLRHAAGSNSKHHKLPV